jgi:uncharacterized protein
MFQCKGDSLNKGSGIMLEKTTRINYLLDFYQALLTSKQQKYMTLYYLDDYSLSEIAELFDISRQAVYDNIKRTEAMLEDYEAKLTLLEKYNQRIKVIQALHEVIDEDHISKEKLQVLLDKLEKLD